MTMGCSLCGRDLADGRWIEVEVAGAGRKAARREVCDPCAVAVGRARERALYRLEPWEFVYTCGVCEYGDRRGEVSWYAHRIARETAKNLWVTVASIPAAHAGTDKEARSKLGGSLFRLDRESFELRGWIRHRPMPSSAFYKAPYVERVQSPREVEEEAERERRAEQWERLRKLLRPGPPPTDDARILGLSWPCTAGELKAAYRRLSKATHPDVGGSAEEFRRINAAYERLAEHFA
jgi:hypothetical protein